MEAIYGLMGWKGLNPFKCGKICITYMFFDNKSGFAKCNHEYKGKIQSLARDFILNDLVSKGLL